MTTVALNHVERLIKEMSLAEKLGQLTMTTAGSTVTGPVIAGDSTEAIRAGTIGSLFNLTEREAIRGMQRLAVEESRLSVPLLFGFDVLHGYRTLFPIPLAEAAAFDPELWMLSAREAAKEAAADGLALTFAPMLDVARDPRWGRSAEGPGEDPYVGSRLAEAKVRGFQGNDLGDGAALAACAKHYCAYGAASGGRDYASVDVSERTLREVYLPPFSAAVASGVACIMPAFTDLAGIPMTANAALLNGWLRRRLGFDGVVVSDYGAVGELVKHGVAADLAQAAALALRAGVDIDMMSGAYRQGLPIALDRGWVSVGDIDEAARRVLTLKWKLGLFDDPYRRGSTAEGAEALETRRRFARAVAVRSLVMLKNDRDLLPVPAAIRAAVLGPLAEAVTDMRGPWPGAAPTEGASTVAAGLKAALGQVTVEAGIDIEGTELAPGSSLRALDLCAQADAIVLCLGEAAAMSGEAASRAHPHLPGRQRRFAEAVFDRARVLSKPVVVILFCGRPLIVPWLMERADAVLAAWFLGSEAGHALADVITGRMSPAGRTPVSWARSVGQVPVYFGARPTGRPADPQDRYTSKYLDVPNDPLFPFGHGLTYGRFRYSGLEVSGDTLTEHGSLAVRVELKNEGVRAAEETVFLFIHDKLASVARPLLELKGFAKIRLEPGRSGTVTLPVSARDLRFLGLDLEPVFEPGEVEILVGPCADRSRLLSATVHLAASRA